ncbi:UPF0228 family protein [Methanosarcina sp. Z-7115]|uniref:UPF0228 family protein n=1 Tax=Methanosarcina baikalica TaxID=3073890 RepID=A0ABU2D2I5_9EURY|nr:UPF0228 family protein [Methanosarcina sp. Z-7115]MDR7666195.1 UPF0228 family protein [Methanosarcina sp. Z-7115]
MMKKSIYKILFIAAIIVFLIIVVPLVLFTPTHVESNMSVNEKTPVKEQQVAGLFIEFENGTTEQEVKTILENSNIPINYSIDYNTDLSSGRHYAKVENDKKTAVVDEFKKGEKFPEPGFPPDIKKGNYYVIVSEQGFENENFLNVMKRNNLQVKMTIICYISFGNEPKNWIPENDAIRIRNELEANEEVFIVNFDGVVG